jgi:hypothetical protein
VLTCIGTSGAEAPPEPTPEQFGKMYQNARMLGALGALGGMGWDLKRPQQQQQQVAAPQPQGQQPVQGQGQGAAAAAGQKDQLSVFAAALMAAQASKLTQAFQFLGDIAKGQQAGQEQQQQQGQLQAPPPPQQQPQQQQQR